MQNTDDEVVSKSNGRGPKLKSHDSSVSYVRYYEGVFRKLKEIMGVRGGSNAGYND